MSRLLFLWAKGPKIGSAGFEPANDWIKTSCVGPLHHEPVKVWGSRPLRSPYPHYLHRIYGSMTYKLNLKHQSKIQSISLDFFAKLCLNQRHGRSTKTQLCQAGAAKTLIDSSATGCELWAGIAFKRFCNLFHTWRIGSINSYPTLLKVLEL